MATPDTIYAKVFGSNLFLKAQQESSRLRNTVTLKPGVTGEEVYVDQLNSFEMQVAGARLQQTNPSLASFDRRRISMVSYEIAKAMDPKDDLRTLADPTSTILQAGSMAAGRMIDDIIITSSTATAYTGKAGGTSTTFPTATQQVSIDHGASNTNFTLAKWLEALRILNANDVDPNEEKTLVIGSSQLGALLNTTEIKSADYNSVKALVNGQIDTYLGCKVIRSERLPLHTSYTKARKCLLYTKSAITLAIGQDYTSRIDTRVDLSMAKQLYFAMTMGASRMEETKVVEIVCNEA